MFASKHPLEDTLVLEIPREEILALHGTLLADSDGMFASPVRDQLLSVLETFHAGGSLERFERPVETHSVAAPIALAPLDEDDDGGIEARIMDGLL